MVFKTHPNEAFILQELLIHHLLTSQSRLQNMHRLEFTSSWGKLAVCCFYTSETHLNRGKLVESSLSCPREKAEAVRSSLSVS